VQLVQLVPQIVLLVLATHAPLFGHVLAGQTHKVPEHTPPVGHVTQDSPQQVPPGQGARSVFPAHGLAGTQLPQSAGQLLHVSPASQLPLPHTVGHGPQSCSQLLHVSLPLHTPSPQTGVGAVTHCPL
jgi:hypothetical protein